MALNGNFPKGDVLMGVLEGVYEIDLAICLFGPFLLENKVGVASKVR